MPDHRPLRLDDQLCFALYAATNEITRAYRPLLKRLGLTYPQYLVMLVLWQDGSSSVSHLANRLSLPANAITPLLDRLEAAGLVERRRGVRDRRVVNVELTEAGAALETDTSAVQWRVECATGLDEQNLSELRDSLKALAERLHCQIPALEQSA